jgi:trehalose 6-phosphate synthase
MTGRLVAVSNRIPTEAEPAGGLMVALHDCLSETGGLWVGAAAEPVAVPSKALTEIGSGAYRRLAFEITEEEHEEFYLGYANSVLWPLFHRRSDLISYDASQAKAYAEVNARVARLLIHELRPDDRLWIHDYHFLPLALELRRLGVRNPIGFFLHTPFPSRADLPALPQHHDLFGWLAAYDLVGLQTERDVAACLEAFRADRESEVMMNGRLRRAGSEVAVAAFPIGIDVARFAADAEANASRGDLALGDGNKLLIGIDRLDYSKGLVERFKGFEAFLDARGPDDPRATFLQIAQLSRTDVEAYRDIREELEATAGRINGRHGTLDWTPIRYLSHGVPREQVAGLMRCAQVCLVTPLADGMNLVAKEFVAAQDPDDPGVLILSRFAGAAEDMTDAIQVNPHDRGEIARAIRTALRMPLDERRARHDMLLDVISSRDVSWWRRSYLRRLDEVSSGRLPYLGKGLEALS